MFKKVKALIEPLDLEEITQALGDLGIEEVTIGKSKNFGRTRGRTRILRGKKQIADFLPEICLEIIVEQEMTQRVIQVIEKAERAADLPDGRIAILPVEKIIFLDVVEPSTPLAGGT